jgi:hypothetical protein
MAQCVDDCHENQLRDICTTNNIKVNSLKERLRHCGEGSSPWNYIALNKNMEFNQLRNVTELNSGHHLLHLFQPRLL